MQTEKRDALSLQNCDESRLVNVTETGEALSQATGGSPKQVLAGGALATTITSFTGAFFGSNLSHKDKKRNTAIGAATGTAVGAAGTAGALIATRGKARVQSG